MDFFIPPKDRIAESKDQEVESVKASFEKAVERNCETYDMLKTLTNDMQHVPEKRAARR